MRCWGRTIYALRVDDRLAVPSELPFRREEHREGSVFEYLRCIHTLRRETVIANHIVSYPATSSFVMDAARAFLGALAPALAWAFEKRAYGLGGHDKRAYMGQLYGRGSRTPLQHPPLLSPRIMSPYLVYLV